MPCIYICDIDSISNEQVKFYTKIFATEDWNKTACKTLSVMIDKVSKEDKEMSFKMSCTKSGKWPLLYHSSFLGV